MTFVRHCHTATSVASCLRTTPQHRYTPVAAGHNTSNCASRYPSGESYLDVIQRLEPVIIEIERERECVCVVAHQAILRALYGAFQGTPLAVGVVSYSVVQHTHAVYRVEVGLAIRTVQPACAVRASAADSVPLIGSAVWHEPYLVVCVIVRWRCPVAHSCIPLRVLCPATFNESMYMACVTVSL